MKAIFILGLDHSRSTILDIVIGKSTRAISLGEVRRTIHPIRNEHKNAKLCSCGKNYVDCVTWESINNTGYNFFLKNQTSIVIDSSKDIKHYKKYSKDINHIVVMPYRKFNNWYVSVKESLKREHRDGFKLRFNCLSDLRLSLRNYKLISYIEYVVTTLRFLFVTRNKRLYIISTTEELISFVKKIKINTSIKEEYKCHMIRGNRLKDKWKTINIKPYDERDMFLKIIKIFKS